MICNNVPELLIFLFPSLDCEFLLGRKDVLFIFVSLAHSKWLRNCLMNEYMPILTSCMYCDLVLLT